MHFVRSMPAPQLGCTFGYGEQQNQITGFHDGSNVYGSDSEEVEKLREHKVRMFHITFYSFSFIYLFIFIFFEKLIHFYLFQF